MTKEEIVTELKETIVVAIIRLDRAEDVYPTAMALFEGGITAIEITVGTPNALSEINKIAQHKGILAGVGSVVDAKTAASAIKAGAQFIVTPASKKEVIDMAHKHGKPILSGAFSPTEILQAYDWGADIIKLFPAGALGINYYKAIKAPMPYIPIMPTGGVTELNAVEWLEHGAPCLGVGSELTNTNLIRNKDFKGITELAKSFRKTVDNFR
ncbi:bifunctional 4-hydroxy-2-oxoglutarate aldolase/2-dehydro-3-deoxy-phosphogluconate aldolase [Aurantibacter sp.]|uniref:bifunctional 4-hydroxy-2-oxoglutarate aldolase/2-dehydro-3-deoxy-phosphogluconate aldolase n=1 Tax=Aurantibacter sp. TaxID=2807103 RepID=UPI003267110A